LDGINISNLVKALKKIFKPTTDHKGRIYVPLERYRIERTTAFSSIL